MAMNRIPHRGPEERECIDCTLFSQFLCVSFELTDVGFLHKNVLIFENICIFICVYARNCIILRAKSTKRSKMKVKNNRMETLKMLISSMELGSQEEVLQALEKEGYKLTQATLSRDLKQLKVAKAASMNGKYVYVLPNETMYKRISKPRPANEMLQTSGFVSINFSGNMGVIKTRPGYASSIAYNIDDSEIPEIIGTIAGDDTIFIVIKEGAAYEDVIDGLSIVIPNIK